MHAHRGFLDVAGMIHVCETRHLCLLLKPNAVFPELRVIVAMSPDTILFTTIPYNHLRSQHLWTRRKNTPLLPERASSGQSWSRRHQAWESSQQDSNLLGTWSHPSHTEVKDNNHVFHKVNSFLSRKSVECRSPAINVTETKPCFVCFENNENLRFKATFKGSKCRKSPKKKIIWQCLAYSRSIPLWRAHTDTKLPTRACSPLPQLPPPNSSSSQRGTKVGVGEHFVGQIKELK